MYTVKGKSGKEHLLEQHAPLVKRLAHHMKAKLPANVEVDDLVQAGMIGLLDAVNRYEDEHGAQFETYAVLRIRGAMLDELRSSVPENCPGGSRRRSSSRCRARAFSKSASETSPRNFRVAGSTTGIRVIPLSAMRYTTIRNGSFGDASTVSWRTSSSSVRCSAASPSCSMRWRISLRVSTPTNRPSAFTTGSSRWL